MAFVGSIVGGVAAAGTGALLGGLLGGGSKQSGSATSTQTASPWAGAQPYLVGQTNRTLKTGVTPTYDEYGNQNNPDSDYTTTTTPGILPEAAKNYTNAAWTPEMASNNQAATNFTGALLNNWQYQPVWQTGSNMVAGMYDPTITAAKDVNAKMVDPTQAFGSFGSANPQNSLSQMLTGQANTSALDPVVRNALTRMSDNFNTQILPQINDGAVAAGQYGSSRQGIAQGLASKALSQAQGDTVANMYNNAFNTAQQQMYGTANNLSGLALGNATNNANRDLTAQTTNVQTQLANNAQNMALQNQVVNNRLQGTNLLNAGIAGQNALYNQQQNNLNTQNAYNNQNLVQYANLVNPTAGMGGTQVSSNPLYTNQTANILGGGMLGMGIYNAYNKGGSSSPSPTAPIYDTSSGGSWGDGVNGGWGGQVDYSDYRMKENIEKVGVLNSGINIYKFEYKPEFKDIAGHGQFIGVMAQEAETVIPNAVVTMPNGYKAVNYSLIH